ncbi:MAG TPA: GAF domain-containing sensor histidine kinase [Anaerolineae bacterium]|nr:GAF domain-containing sensor histidine kinase [Anaerolineae bacterium]
MTDITTIDSQQDISPRLQAVLQQVVDDVVARLGCRAAMVATLEEGNALQGRAFAVAVSPRVWRPLQEMIGISPVSSEAVIFLNERKYSQNLGVRAVKSAQSGGAKYLTGETMHDLFRPVVGKKLCWTLQKALGVKQVIAVPFFIEDEVVGNLFAASDQAFVRQDLEFLVALGAQAAVAIQSQRHLEELQSLESIFLNMQANITDEQMVLQTIVDAVVNQFDFVGALVATLEDHNALPVRAYNISVAPNLIHQWESMAGVSFTGPRAVVFLNNEKYQDNLSVRAVKGSDGHPERYLISDSLYDLFRPIVPRAVIAVAQKVLGVKQVIAVPFFLEDEVVGNLFAATTRPSFTEREISLLTTLGQQAAVGLRNARLYRVAEERREIAQMFGRMAFSAAASIHALRNQIGAARSILGLLERLPAADEKQEQILGYVPSAVERLTRAATILDNLHEPWRHTTDEEVNLNDCVIWSLGEVFAQSSIDRHAATQTTIEGVTLHLDLAEDIPAVITVADMLTESLRIMIKNAKEAIVEHQGSGDLWLTSQRYGNDGLQFELRDNGIGIAPAHLQRIFDMGWSTKGGQGMGFGLFWTKDFIDGLGGTIEVKSIQGEGTTFTITLPNTHSTDSK